MITVAKIDTTEIEDKADDTKNKAAAALTKKGGQSRAQKHNRRQQAEIVKKSLRRVEEKAEIALIPVYIWHFRCLAENWMCPVLSPLEHFPVVCSPKQDNNAHEMLVEFRVAIVSIELLTVHVTAAVTRGD